MEMVLFIGIPGSGKSTFYRERFFDTHVRINLDMLKTRHREMTLIQACIAARQPFVVDNTNVSTVERARYIPLARQVGYRVVGVYFRSNLAEALKRNQQRAGKALVPAQGVRARFNLLELPHVSEGFDQLYYVWIDPFTSRFNIEEWKDAD